MKFLEYKLFSGGFINRFLTAGVFTKENPFRKTVLQGKVNEWLIKGYSIHDNQRNTITDTLIRNSLTKPQNKHTSSR